MQILTELVPLNEKYYFWAWYKIITFLSSYGLNCRVEYVLQPQLETGRGEENETNVFTILRKSLLQFTNHDHLHIKRTCYFDKRLFNKKYTISFVYVQQSETFQA